jgi:hypothetical protein
MYGVAIGVITLLLARESLDGSMWLFQENHPPNAALGVTGLLISTFGPLALSVGVWLVTRRLKARWLAHLIFIPAAIVICREGMSLFFYGVGASGDGSPEGYATLLAVMYLLLTLVVHATALIVEGYKKVRQRANGS